MKMQRSILLCTLLVACAAELPGSVGDASDPEAKTAALPDGVGVLGADFDPERVAPARATGATGHEHHHGAGAPAAPTSFTCSHHTDVVSDKPGKCPKCGMDLVPKQPASQPLEPATAPDPHGGH